MQLVVHLLDVDSVSDFLVGHLGPADVLLDASLEDSDVFDVALLLFQMRLVDCRIFTHDVDVLHVNLDGLVNPDDLDLPDIHSVTGARLDS